MDHFHIRMDRLAVQLGSAPLYRGSLSFNRGRVVCGAHFSSTKGTSLPSAQFRQVRKVAPATDLLRLDSAPSKSLIYLHEGGTKAGGIFQSRLSESVHHSIRWHQREEFG